jgi:predicted transposase/invertase (TIGR01784 family)
MSKFRSLKNPDIKGNIIHRWLTYLNPDANESSLNEVIKMDTAIAKANEKMIRLTNDPEVVRAYDMRRLAKRDEQGRLLYARDEGMNEGIAIGKNEGIAIGKNEGIAIGKNEGIAIGKREIARSLKSLGSAPDFIAKATGLSLEEIEKL